MSVRGDQGKDIKLSLELPACLHHLEKTIDVIYKCARHSNRGMERQD